VELDLDKATDVAFWRELCPTMTIDRAPGPGQPALSFEPSPGATERFAHDGYLHVPDVVPVDVTSALVDCAERLHAAEIPTVFAFVYDEAWQLFRSLRTPLAAMLGLDLQPKPAFWCWYLPVDGASAGWAPHRDEVRRTSDEDGTLRAVSAWVALNDATPLNGCMYAVPAHLDRRFRNDEWERPDDEIVRLQDVRALPAEAGSVLIWHQGLRHWGGRSSRDAASARCSMSMEYQRADTAPLDPDLAGADLDPPFAVRLHLIGRQLLQYRHMQRLDPDLEVLAGRLNAGCR